MVSDVAVCCHEPFVLTHFALRWWCDVSLGAARCWRLRCHEPDVLADVAAVLAHVAVLLPIVADILSVVTDLFPCLAGIRRGCCRVLASLPSIQPNVADG